MRRHILAILWGWKSCGFSIISRIVWNRGWLNNTCVPIQPHLWKNLNSNSVFQIDKHCENFTSCIRGNFTLNKNEKSCTIIDDEFCYFIISRILNFFSSYFSFRKIRKRKLHPKIVCLIVLKQTNRVLCLHVAAHRRR